MNEMHCPACWERVAEGATVCFACGTTIQVPEGAGAPEPTGGGDPEAGEMAQRTPTSPPPGAGDTGFPEAGKTAPTEAERRADLAQAVHWFREAIGRAAQEAITELATVEARLHAARARAAELRAEAGPSTEKQA